MRCSHHDMLLKNANFVWWAVGGLGAVALGVSLFFVDGILAYHVSAACLTYLFFLGCVGFNIGAGVLATRSAVGDAEDTGPRRYRVSCLAACAVSCCDVGLLFSAETLVTGAWWGHIAWGVSWIWEPRLTGMFLMTLCFMSWRLACAILGAEMVSKGRLTACLILLGLPSMAFTHVASQLFGGIHPATVEQSGAIFPASGWMVDVVLGHLLAGLACAGAIVRRKMKNRGGDSSHAHAKTMC